jgi:hypothetical protein
MFYQNSGDDQHIETRHPVKTLPAADGTRLPRTPTERHASFGGLPTASPLCLEEDSP